MQPLIKQKDKNGALPLLKHIKVYQKQMETLSGQQLVLQEQLMNIESCDNEIIDSISQAAHLTREQSHIDLDELKLTLAE